MNREEAIKIFDEYNNEKKQHPSYKERVFISFHYFDKAKVLYVEFSYFGGCQDIKDPEQLYHDVVELFNNDIADLKEKIANKQENLFFDEVENDN